MKFYGYSRYFGALPGVLALSTLSAVNRPVVRATSTLSKPTIVPTIVLRTMVKLRECVKSKSITRMAVLQALCECKRIEANDDEGRHWRRARHSNGQPATTCRSRSTRPIFWWGASRTARCRCRNPDNAGHRGFDQAGQGRGRQPRRRGALGRCHRGVDERAQTGRGHGRGISKRRCSTRSPSHTRPAAQAAFISRICASGSASPMRSRPKRRRGGRRYRRSAARPKWGCSRSASCWQCRACRCNRCRPRSTT